MAKYLSELDFLYPSSMEILPPARLARRPGSLERKDREFARTAATLDKVRLKVHVLDSDMSSPVSRPRNNFHDIDQLESFADRLIRDNARKQAQPDIVTRNIRRTHRLLELEPPRVTARPASRFDQAHVTGRLAQNYPRTVFGTEAWTRSSLATRTYFINKVLALPCIERMVRREVLFAKGKGGRGYKVSHRPGKFSDIWC